MRTEFRTDRVFTDLSAAQAELDEWVADYNTDRPHQALGHGHPGRAVRPTARGTVTPLAPSRRPPDSAAVDGTWVARRASAVGVVCVNWQQVCLGAPPPAATSTSGSPTRSCSSTTATSCCAPRNATTPDRSERSEPRYTQAPTLTKLSRINRTRSVTHQPKLDKGA